MSDGLRDSAGMRASWLSGADSGSAEAEARERLGVIGFAETERRIAELERRLQAAEADSRRLREALEDIVAVGENTHIWRHVRVAKAALDAVSGAGGEVKNV